MMNRLCYVCNTSPAEVPDRYTTGRQIKRICRECHADRLRDDLRFCARTRQAAKALGSVVTTEED